MTVELIQIKENTDFPKILPKRQFIEFLYTHLQEYRDTKEDITKAVDYTFSKESGKGGFLLAAIEKGIVLGEVVINDSGMSGYIPEHVLVYIAVRPTKRGKGIGKKLIQKAIELCDGDISLHVEYDNPALKIYKHIGFTSKYAEMRYKNKEKKRPDG
jgi:ribosomal-protein-alanine N-acetyltransferase